MGILLSDNEERIFILGVQAFQEYTKGLIDIIGLKVVKELFYRGGLNAGRYELRKIKALIQSEDICWNLLNGLMKSRGWDFIARHERTTKNGFHYEVEYANSRFAQGLNLPDPICDLVPGLLAGSLEILHGTKEVASVETKCVARGVSYCLFHLDLAHPND